MSDLVRDKLQAIFLELDQLRVDVGSEQILSDIKSQLAAAIEATPSEEAVQLSVSEQMRLGIVRFEAEHPALAKAAEEVVESMSRLGI